MEMYKVGDEVLVKGEVIEVMNDVPYPVRVRLGSDNGGLVFTNDELCYADKIVKTYEMGLNDAWGLARKLILAQDDGGISLNDIDDIFGKSTYCTFRDFTFEDCRDKIEAYERKKEIKVGDVVKLYGGLTKGIVTRVCPEGVHVVWIDGVCGNYQYSHIEKTGRTAEGLEGLLRQIGE